MGSPDKGHDNIFNSAEAKAHVFNSLLSRQEILMEEAKAYLASISSSAGSNEINGSVETKTTDNCSFSSSDGSKSSSSPSLSARLDTNANVCKGNGGDLDVREKQSRSQSLIPISEDGGEFPQSDYYNDFSYDTDPGARNQFDDDDDDSLVLMAKRLDAASIISDPSTICGPTEKFLALPSSVKKLGRKISRGGNRKPPPPPPLKKPAGTGVKQHDLPPRPPTTGSQQLIQLRANNPASAAFPTDSVQSEMLAAATSTMKRDLSPSSGYPSSSSKENIHFTSADEDSLEPPYDFMPQNFSSTKAATKNNLHKKKERRGSSSRTRNVSTYEERGSGRRGSRGKSRESRSPLNSPPPMAETGGDFYGGVPPDVPTKSATSPFAGGKTVERSGLRTECRCESHTPKKGNGSRRKRQQKKCNDESDDDEEYMQGIGFNTRIHHHHNNRPNSTDYTISGEKSASNHPEKQPQVGRSSDTHGPLPRAAASMSQQKAFESCSERSDGDSNYNSDDDSSYHSDDKTEIFYETVTEDESENDAGTAYDSDAHTQIFYESTDDDDSELESDEEPITSVAQAVQNLNNKRAVTKVKNLFGIRG